MAHSSVSAQRTPRIIGAALLVQLFTPWHSIINASSPHSDYYPRPQMVRDDILYLNGPWQWQAAPGDEEHPSPPFNATLSGTILVPFPVEANLSGVGRHEPRMWYRRELALPAAWPVGQRVLLHFDAVDQEASVWFNGVPLGSHAGGYTRFSFDTTHALATRGAGPHELLVLATDHTEFHTPERNHPLGKQRMQHTHAGITYTSSSGIWRTVWMEPVPATHLTHLRLVPNIDTSTLSITAFASAAAAGARVSATAFDNSGNAVASGAGAINEPFELRIPHAQLWSPDSPYLYDLTAPAAAPGDVVRSYFGMRKVSVGRDAAGSVRLRLNNRPVFMLGMLDQGFWPDGLYTPPTQDAWVADIQMAKSLGYNTLRKHVKVEPEQFYFLADRLGMLVWQDMPSMCGMWEMPGATGEWYFDGCWVTTMNVTTAHQRQFEAELVAMVRQLSNHPSIVQWVVFNEGWGQYAPRGPVDLVLAQDASRLVSSASGWVDDPSGSIRDAHIYAPRLDNSTGLFNSWATGGRASVVGEFGGYGLNVTGHMLLPNESHSYHTYATPAELVASYLAYLQDVKARMQEPAYAINGAIYTEVSDVESEVNGWATYDRQLKIDDAAVRSIAAAHADLIAAVT
ncbi:hypothetical protein WJX81_000830 [Elliptochloris bilobata]|uniref:Glycoside hydrolase family 2 n=1 Tax=Elliptochloris bilobata TaxID=381761 RepID=A0AAW1RQM7_9CHLO